MGLWAHSARCAVVIGTIKGKGYEMSYRDRREARADRLDGGEITATAMSSTLATYNLDNMRRSFASLAAEVTP